MSRRSGYKIYTKVSQYFTDDNSIVSSSYIHNFTGSSMNVCGNTFNSGTLYTSSLSCGRWTDCLYGSDGNAGSNSNYFLFTSGSNTSSACVVNENFRGYIDTPTINVGVSGSRLYVSGTLCPADQKYYGFGGNWYQVGDTNGTITASGSCSVGGDKTLSWNYTISGGATGQMKIYLNGSAIETRSNNSSGTWPLSTGDQIYFVVDTSACSGGNNIANSYTLVPGVPSYAILANATCNNGSTSLTGSTYTVQSGDTTISVNAFSRCDSGCV